MLNHGSAGAFQHRRKSDQEHPERPLPVCAPAKSIKLAHIAVATLLTTLCNPTAADTPLAPSTIEGVYWAPVRKDGKIRIEQHEGEWVGRIIAVKPSRKDQLDVHNPDPALRDKPVLGSLCMIGFQFSQERQRWIDGKVYDCKTGDLYDGYLWLDDQGNLNARGYLLFAFIGRTANFERVNGPRPLEPQPDEPELVYWSGLKNQK